MRRRAVPGSPKVVLPRDGGGRQGEDDGQTTAGGGSTQIDECIGPNRGADEFKTHKRLSVNKLDSRDDSGGGVITGGVLLWNDFSWKKRGNPTSLCLNIRFHVDSLKIKV
ncbi:hypothetical protein L1987_24157 [Smallanthus sonchifolius]|uniref:Uncharacterized protein n=1 Tax=Smallanthus sonchifolius TaxID=185202 RepID=A0ACB9IIY3_9ASTR|nr:hypothetical protein L1987_24157 [Smallanthus sonchifolius]